MDMEKSPAEMLAAAAVYAADGKLRGYNLRKADGHVVLALPTRLVLAASVERGLYVAGLDEGEELVPLEEPAVEVVEDLLEEPPAE